MALEKPVEKSKRKSEHRSHSSELASSHVRLEWHPLGLYGSLLNLQLVKHATKTVN